MANDQLQLISDVWNKGVEIFNKYLTKDPKKRLDSPRSIVPKSNHCTLEKLTDITIDRHQECYSHPGRGVTQIHKTLRAVKTYAAVTDVIVQHDPHFTAIAWGLIRLTIAVWVAEIDLGEQIGATLQEILNKITWLELEIKLSAEEPRVLEAIARVFSQIINYLVRAYCHCSQHSIKRHTLAIFPQKLTQIPGTIDRLVAEVEHHIRATSESSRSRFTKAAETEFLRQEEYRKECRISLRQILDAQQSETSYMKDQIIDLRKMLTGFEAALLSFSSGQGHQDNIKIILRWLEESKQQPNHIPAREPGTCEWILTNERYQNWLSTPHRQCLWIRGITGAGKSVLSSFLTNELLAQSNVVLKYSFHSWSDQKPTKATHFLMSLLRQLLLTPFVESDPRFKATVDEIASLARISSTGCECSLSALQRILKAMLETLPKYVIIVDGLQDCVQEDQSFNIPEYVRELGTSQNLLVIVLSRPCTHLETVFSDVAQISMDCVEVVKDIELYVSQRIDRTLRLKSLRDEILEKASLDCGGMFLRAKLMLNGLDQCLGTPRAIRNRLRETSRELSVIYEQQWNDNAAKLSPEALIERDNILLLLKGSKRPLSVQEISAALALNTVTNLSDQQDELIEPAQEIESLCQPLITVMNHIADFGHESAKQFLSNIMSDMDSSQFLARKCLSTLIQPRYRNWEYVVELLEKHLLAESSTGGRYERFCEESDFYNYACLHWHEHVVALRNPPKDILEKLATFLVGNAFVTWSEVLMDLKCRADLGPLIRVRTDILTWYEGLDSPIKDQVPIEQFFEFSHKRLSEELDEKSSNRLLLYLPFARLGSYFNLGGQSTMDWQKAYEYKKKVVEGYKRILGDRDQLTLNAQTLLFQEFFWQRRFLEAETGLSEVAELQRQNRGEENFDYLATRQLLGLAQFSVTNFQEARKTLTQTEEGLKKLRGESDMFYLMTRLYRGYVLERQAEIREAFELYDTTLQTWNKLANPSSPFSLMLQTAIGSVYRKMREFDRAEEALVNAWQDRKRIFTINNNVSVDSAHQLALLYRESGYAEKARKVLDDVQKSKIFGEDLERCCQIMHIHALLDLDAAQHEKAQLTLENLLTYDREKNNRELLWVRIDLADILRQHGEKDEAIMLFSRIVEPVTPDPCSDRMSPTLEFFPSLVDEPEPIDRLKTAERALRLVREARPEIAETVLQEKGLRWVRQEDFWIVQGGPITDTAWLAHSNYKKISVS